ncbi:MAG: FAD-dependent oxidoreductase [Lachnospiraceae bacterium]|nr:FAD-dependent oxidoreductase [Lachnospiraceae bacterium]
MAYYNDLDLSTFYDVIIIGAGPAGLTAALSLGRACYRVAVIERQKQGGLVSVVSEIVNYPGTPSIGGSDLIKQMRSHAEHFGAEFINTEVTALTDMEDDIKTVVTKDATYHCYGVLLATGAPPKDVGFKGEAAYRGRGIAYTAPVDGEFFTGKEIFVIGAGTTAAEDSVFLTKYASHVTALVPSEDFTCDAAFWTRALEHPHITVIKNIEILEVTGDSLIRSLVWKDRASGEVTTFRPESGDTFGVFILTGHLPETGLVRGLVDLDALYYVPVDRRQRTNLPGLYAAGDVCSYTFRQVLTAASGGATAALDLIKFVYRMQTKVGICPVQPVRRATLHKTVDGAPGGESLEKKSLFAPEMLSQLYTVFARFEKDLVLHLFPDARPVSGELISYMNSLAGLEDKLSVRLEDVTDDEPEFRPCVRVEYTDETPCGFAFHGMPGGNEFNSFILGLYNASCSGQAVSDTAMEKIRSIDHDIHIDVFVTLTCTMCPDLVTAMMRIATLTPHVSCDVYDLNHFQSIRERYNVMSVPCYIIEGREPMFGLKSVDEILEVL